jgi:hypothetical protein
MLYGEDKMNSDDKSNKAEEKAAWGYRKSISGLDASESSMSDDRKELIRKALDFDIIDIRSYAGYKGDLLIQITTMDENVMQALKEVSENLGLEAVVKKNLVGIYEIFCIAPASDIYELK